jgi:hypothetical protein
MQDKKAQQMSFNFEPATKEKVETVDCANSSNSSSVDFSFTERHSQKESKHESRLYEKILSQVKHLYGAS